MACFSFYIGNAIKSTLYIFRDIIFSLFLYEFAASISPWSQSDFGGYVAGWAKTLLTFSLWSLYYWFQSLVMAGMFVLGHDAGHGTLYDNSLPNNIVGFLSHTVGNLAPYFFHIY